MRSDEDHIVLGGRAGTGKSTILAALKEDENTVVCGMTGMAGVDLKIPTMHSALGLGMSPEELSIDELVDRIEKSGRAGAFQKQKLVVDEAGQWPLKLFLQLDKVGRRLRRTPNKPFGGLKLRLIGHT